MATPTDNRRWWLAALVLGALVVGLGCNPFGTIAFLLEPECPVEPKLALADKDKEVKVVVLCYFANLEDHTELMGAERELNSRVISMLEERFKENKDKVKFVPPGQVKGYLSRHPDWHNMQLRDIGKHFEADFVLNLELSNMTLYERGSRNQLYRGRADVKLTVVDVAKPDGEGVRYDETMPAEYPTSRQYHDVNDMGWQQFRTLFLTNMARNIAQRFASYPKKHRYDADGTE